MHSKNTSSTEKWQERLDVVWWLVGFVDGEGTFSVSLFRNKTSKLGWQVFPEFVVTQGARSYKTLLTAKEFFGCGDVYINRRKDNHKEDLYRYCVRSVADLTLKVLPFFEKYKLKTAKGEDFMNFSKILFMMRAGKHLNATGLRKIALLIQQMNRKKESQYLKSQETIRQVPK